MSIWTVPLVRRPAPRFSGTRPAEAGFSLVETLVAFTVAGLTLAVYFQVLGRAATAAQLSKDRLTAAAYAQSKLASLGAAEPLAEGASRGAFDGDFSWEAAVTRDAALGARHGGASMRPLVIALKVSWKRGRAERAVTYNALRLSPLIARWP